MDNPSNPAGQNTSLPTPTPSAGVNYSQSPFPPPVAPANTTGPEPSIVPPPPKKGIPKIAIFIGIGILAVALIFGVIKILGSRVTSTTNAITWWGLWEDSSAVSPLISEYETAHPNVKITYVKQSPQDYRERLTNALAKGTGPDIFRFHNTWVPMFRNDLDTLPSSVINPADFAKSFYPVASSDLTSGTGIVGVPIEYDALTLFINEDIFNKAGKTPPTTWDELRVLAKELTVKDDQGTITQSGVALGRTENVDHWPEILALMMIQNGVDLSNPTGAQAEGALSFFTIFSTDDGVWDVTLPSSTQAFVAGKLAMYIGPSWRAFDIKAANPNLKFKTVPIPQLPKDNPNQPDITYATYWAEGVSAKSTKKAEAWDFLKFLSTQASMQKLFQNESKTRSFGEPYSRVDMANLLSNHPILGSIVSQAPGARSWYLASRTFDGPTGINSQLANYFGDAVNAVADGKMPPQKALQTAASGVQQVLAQYKLIAK